MTNLDNYNGFPTLRKDRFRLARKARREGFAEIEESVVAKYVLENFEDEGKWEIVYNFLHAFANWSSKGALQVLAPLLDANAGKDKLVWYGLGCALGRTSIRSNEWENYFPTFLKWVEQDRWGLHQGLFLGLYLESFVPPEPDQRKIIEAMSKISPEDTASCFSFFLCSYNWTVPEKNSYLRNVAQPLVSGETLQSVVDSLDGYRRKYVPG